jgi:hypothetical protein
MSGNPDKPDSEKWHLAGAGAAGGTAGLDHDEIMRRGEFSRSAPERTYPYSYEKDLRDKYRASGLDLDALKGFEFVAPGVDSKQDIVWFVLSTIPGETILDRINVVAAPLEDIQGDTPLRRKEFSFDPSH